MPISTASSHPYTTTGGQGFGLFPRLAECTVSEAARFLGGSEGYVDELLRDGVIVFRLESGERLVQWDSLLDYAQRRKRNFAALAEMIRMDQEMGLYDD